MYKKEQVKQQLKKCLLQITKIIQKKITKKNLNEQKREF